MPTQSRTIRALPYYVGKMGAGERECRMARRHVWPTDKLVPGMRKIPPGVKVIGEIDRLRIIEYCESCGSEGTSFRLRDGHLNMDDRRRRVTHGPDWQTIPREVEAWPSLIRAVVADSDAIARLFRNAAQTI